MALLPSTQMPSAELTPPKPVDGNLLSDVPGQVGASFTSLFQIASRFASTFDCPILLNAAIVLSSFIDETVAEMRQRIGKSRVICGLSGGVDSSVCAALLLKAIGPQVACIFVDNGLLRRGESDAVRKTFRDHFKADLIVAEARDRFLKALDGVDDPQKKRTIIGHVFIDVFKDEARRIE